MKVSCIKIINPITNEPQTKSPYLTLGKEYIVLEVLILPEKDLSYRLIDDDNYTPSIHDSPQFEIVSSHIPSNWVIDQSAPYSRIITLAPKEWNIRGFWDDYFDMKAEALAIFEKEKNIIYAEESAH